MIFRKRGEEVEEKRERGIKKKKTKKEKKASREPVRGNRR